jgi:hypothetical protein
LYALSQFLKKRNNQNPETRNQNHGIPVL